MDGKEDKQIYTPPAPSSEVYTDEELQAIVESSTWVHLRAMAYEVIKLREAARQPYPTVYGDWALQAAEHKTLLMRKERDEAREWAIKLYQENRRLLSRIGELEVELEEARIAWDNALKWYSVITDYYPLVPLRLTGDRVFGLVEKDNNDSNP